jgi:hypothetical protein
MKGEKTLFVELVERSDERYGPPFEVVVKQASMESDTSYTTELIESFWFDDEKSAAAAYNLAVAVLAYVTEVAEDG